MSKNIINVGLDVHKESIDVGLAAEGTSEIRHYGTIGGDLVSLDRVIGKLTSDGGDRVKTDRRDAAMIARLFRAGELKGIYVPTEEDEALRDMTRARESAMIHFGRTRKELLSFLLRNGIVYSGKTHWKKEHLNWLSKISLPLPAQQIVFQEMLHQIEESNQRMQRLNQQIEQLVETWRWKPVVLALQALRGVRLVVSAGIVAELGDMSRFPHPRALMCYVGLVTSEYSSGAHRCQGAITKTGNVHVRRLLIESAWQYIHGPRVSEIIRKRQQDLPQPIIDIAWKAQLRLCRKYRRMVLRGKNNKVAAVAVARELVAFMWAIHRQVVLKERSMIAA